MSELLGAVVAAARRLDEARDGLQHAVDDARAAGASWADLGRVLGTSRQAAFKRFGHPRDPRTGGTMSTRSTDYLPALVEQVLRDVDAGDYAAVRSRMPDDVAAVLTEDAVLGAWARVVAEVGNLEGFEGTRVEPAGDAVEHGHDAAALGVVVGDTTVRCEAGEVRGRVAVDDADRVVGILVVPLDATDLPF